MQLISKLLASPARFEVISLAQKLVVNGQNVGYWRSTPVPVPVRHRLPWEATRRWAIFVLPLLFIVLMTQAQGFRPFFAVLLGGVLMAYLLNLQLEESLHKLYQIQCQDRGRYEAVQTISRLLDVPPEDVTLAFVECLSRAYDTEPREYSPKKRHQASHSTPRQSHRHAQPSWKADVATATEASIVVSASLEEAAPMVFDSWQPSYQSINPASGLLMVGGDFGWDIGGNLYGFND